MPSSPADSLVVARSLEARGWDVRRAAALAALAMTFNLCTPIETETTPTGIVCGGVACPVRNGCAPSGCLADECNYPVDGPGCGG